MEQLSYGAPDPFLRQILPASHQLHVSPRASNQNYGTSFIEGPQANPILCVQRLELHGHDSLLLNVWSKVLLFWKTIGHVVHVLLWRSFGSKPCTLLRDHGLVFRKEDEDKVL